MQTLELLKQSMTDSGFLSQDMPFSGIISKHADTAVLEVSWKILNHFIERKSSIFSVKELADIANISERTFYRYFPRKEDVVRPIFSASTKSFVDYFSGRPDSEPIANSLISAFDQSWWANHPEDAKTIWYIMYGSLELRAVWLQVIIDIEGILSEALAARLRVAPNSRQASLAATVVTAAIRHAMSDFSDSNPKETLTQSFAHNIVIVGPQVFKLSSARKSRQT
jgi:AcrR family transcriptional regulator